MSVLEKKKIKCIIYGIRNLRFYKRSVRMSRLLFKPCHASCQASPVFAYVRISNLHAYICVMPCVICKFPHNGFKSSPLHDSAAFCCRVWYKLRGIESRTVQSSAFILIEINPHLHPQIHRNIDFLLHLMLCSLKFY